MPDDNFLWMMDEYQAVVDYKGNWYSAINLLLSDNITVREKKGENNFLSKTAEEFKKILKTTIDLYSAIRKDYILNGGKPYSKKLFRGGRIGKIDRAFLSTSDKFATAFGFAKMYDRISGGILYAIESRDVPYINVGKYIFDRYSDIEEDDEPEILFLPCQYKKTNDISINDCIEIAQNQGEKILIANTIKRKFGKLRCEEVELEELDYSKEKTDLTEDDLCMVFSEYKKILK